MNRQRHDERMAISALRVSRGYFPNSIGSSSDVMMGHSFLFIRDLPLGIMPMGHGIDTKEWHVTLDPAEGLDLTEWISTLLDIDRHGYGKSGLAPAVSSFIEEIAKELAYSGETYYEVVTRDTEASPAPVYLLPLPLGPVRLRGNVYLQSVPEADRDPGAPSEIAIPREKIVRFALPPSLGTPEEHRALLRDLVKLSNPMPRFALEGADLGKGSGYDFAAHHRAQDAAIEHAMASWGTVPSVRWLKGTTEYFFVARTLQFRRAQALIREQIVRDLNLLLDRLAVSRHLIVTGLPTAGEILVAMERLERGEIDFKSAMAIVEM
jgi:hypothetical protein